MSIRLRHLYLYCLLCGVRQLTCDATGCSKDSSEGSGGRKCHLEVRNPANDPNEPKKQITITSATDATIECCVRDLQLQNFIENKVIFVRDSNLSLSTFVKEISRYTDDLQTDSIYFQDSLLYEVPKDAFSAFRNIRQLFLHGNGISTLVPHSFYNLTKLQVLELSDNFITSIPRHAFSLLPKLVRISLRQNLITTIDFTMLDHSRNLNEIDLSYNRLKRINDDVNHICHVRKLYLDHNQLTYISPNGSCMTNLMDITLDNNNLTTLPVELSAIFRSETETPIIENNPWICDCRIGWLIHLAIQSGTADRVTCLSPANTTMQYFNSSVMHCPLALRSEEEPSSGTSLYAVLLVCIGGSIMAGILATIVCFRKRRRKSLSTKSPVGMCVASIRHAPIELVANSNYDLLYSNSSSTLMTSSSYTNSSTLKVGKLLGSGAFGDVYDGYSADIEDGKRKVAIKMIKETSSGQEYAALEREFKQLTQIDRHPHIIQVFSIGKIDGSFVMVMEIAEYGDLLSNLRKIKEREDHLINCLTKEQEKCYLLHHQPRLFMFMLHVARGMEYLSQLKILHRDLAARNILLCTGPVAKIADFGLSRDVYEAGYYYHDIKGRYPFKWLSPESLRNGRSTVKGDVWSFGVLMWEIVTLGGEPYNGVQLAGLVALYRNGYVMAQPDLCEDKIYAIMKRCWDHCVDTRPEFTFVVEALDTFIQNQLGRDFQTEPDEWAQLISRI